MALKPIWLENTNVRSSEADFLSRWKLSGIFGAMVEAAAHHADHLGVGYQELLSRDIVWVLSRLKIRIHRFPRVQEPVTIQTWPKGIQQKIFYMRDYFVLAEDGSHLASATSAYVLANTKTRRMLSPQGMNGELPENHGLNALDEGLDKIPVVEPLEERFTTSARYSSVEVIGHVNNTRYIDWVSDCFSFDEHRAMQLSWLQINYINEVRPGDQIAIQRGMYPGNQTDWYVTGSNLTTGAKAFDAQIGWEQSTWNE